MFQEGLLKDDQVQPLAEGVLTVLEKVGIVCQNDEIIKALEACGAQVDYGSQRVWFPRKPVAEFIEDFRQENAARPDGQAARLAPPGIPRVRSIGQFYYDYEKQEKRVLDKAQAKVNELIAQYTKPEGREDQLAAMRAVLERARRELLG